MKFIKNNQIVIYVIALMVIVAGYLNFTTTNDNDSIIKTSSSEEELTKFANIGDAEFVSANIENEERILKIDDNIVNDENIIDSQENSISTSGKIEKDDSEYFSTSKLERDRMYSQMIETYQKVLDSNNSLETQREAATEEITKINNIKNSIMICENLIKTKGFTNSIIFVNGSSISIIVQDDNLNKEDVAQIQNIISREMNATAENIHISTK